MRNLESHMRTVDYFNRLGWVVGYDISHDAYHIYTLVIFRPNAKEPCYYSYHQSLMETMITASEWLVETVQGSDTHA